MKVRYILAVAAALSVSTPSFAADEAEAIFKEANCNNCHAPEWARVGPSVVKIADKYRDDKDAQEKLEKKVRVGSVGTWGLVPMPGTRSSISDEKIKMLVTWILKQKAKPVVDPKADDKTDKKVEQKKK